MKHLPRITLLLWGLMIAGYVFLPEVVLRDAVQYPFVVLLSIFLPISLWLSVQDGKKLGVVILARNISRQCGSAGIRPGTELHFMEDT